MAKSSKDQQKDLNKKRRHALELGIGLGLVLPICLAGVITTAALLTSCHPTNNDFKFIITSGPEEGKELPTEITLTPNEMEKVYVVKPVCNGDKIDVSKITIDSTDTNKFNGRAIKNYPSSKKSTWTIEIYATNEAQLQDNATITFIVNDSDNNQYKYNINTWYEPISSSSNFITYGGVEYELAPNLDPDLFSTW